jgi:hypothetical protein
MEGHVTPFRDYEHLLRLAALFAAGAALFVGLRWLLVPADYGELGAYRAGAIAQIRATPIAFAGQLACVDCHSDVADTRKANAHERISCETCHGPLAAHAADPAAAAGRPDARAACAVCHVPNAAKPPGFKTVSFTEHADEGACTACHPAHAPRFW